MNFRGFLKKKYIKHFKFYGNQMMDFTTFALEMLGVLALILLKLHVQFSQTFTIIKE